MLGPAVKIANAIGRAGVAAPAHAGKAAIAAGALAGGAGAVQAMDAEQPAAAPPQIEPVGKGNYRVTVAATSPEAQKLAAFGEGADNGDGTVTFTLSSAQKARVFGEAAPAA